MIHNKWEFREREKRVKIILFFSILSILIFFPKFFFFKKDQKSEKSLKFQAKTSEFWEKLEDTKNAKKSIIILTEKNVKDSEFQKKNKTSNYCF